MPLIGFGTWMIQGQACYDAVLAAITAGYRHIDTAQAYQNEDQVSTGTSRWMKKISFGKSFLPLDETDELWQMSLNDTK